ncbi:MAG: flagellar basal body P-ring formation chaperone FlgA [Rhizomicrobium sp.]
MKIRLYLIFGALIAGFALTVLPGTAYAGGQRIVVPVHDIARGDVVGPADFTVVPVSGITQSGTVTAAAQISGLETRRALRAGEAMRTVDFRHPIIVTKGSTVTMVYEVPGVSLNATMRAISAGGMGEMVTVQNPVSFRQVSAIVIGPGQVKAVTGSGLTITAGAASVPTATLSSAAP